MNRQPEQHHAVHRVVLPSGKTIEVVYFVESGAQDAARPQEQREGTTLHVCPDCASRLVYPTAWEEAGEGWELTLRCPNCEWMGGGVYEQTTVERLDEELDNGTQVLVRDLKQLMRANMEEEVERFVSALQADQIHPMDF